VKKILTVFAVLLLFSSSLFAVVTACDETNPFITLSPPEGFAMTMITGIGFDDFRTISIAYDDVVQSTIPTTIKTDNKGSFTAIISIPDELAVGIHTITATDSHGHSASSIFTVVDMTGPQGVQGIAGQNGEDGIDGVNGKDGTNGANGLNGQDFNATGNVLVYNGTDGLNGEDGLNGINGINGINGKNGTNGLNGAQGPPGSQGLQGTTEQVIITEPNKTDGIDFQSYIAILIIALIAFTAAMVAVYRKSNN
jgi:hypothetical protein